MTEPISLTPDLVSIGAQALVANANRLGITWRLRLGTVTSAIDENSALVRLDGDTNSITVVSMMGDIAAGRRVYVITIPPGGNYAIGLVDAIGPGGRIASGLRTSASAGFTAETVVDTVTASLIDAATYGVWWYAQIQSTVAGDAAGGKIREDTVAGNVLTNQRVEMADAGAGYGVAQYGEYTATATGNKVFVGTFVRSNGTGTLTASASVNQQANIHVCYLFG